MQRRRLLAALPAIAAAGCLAAPGGEPPSSPRADGGDDAATTATGTPADGDGPGPKGPTRGEAEPIATRRVETDDDVEYLSDEDAVRYVAAWRHANHDEVENGSAAPTREPVYETTGFEDWARTRCTSAGAEAAAARAAGRLGVEGVGAGISSAVPGRDLAATVSTTTVLDREGDVVGEPAVAFEPLVDATPGTVEATYAIDGREHATDVPLYVVHRVMQQQ